MGSEGAMAATSLLVRPSSTQRAKAFPARTPALKVLPPRAKSAWRVEGVEPVLDLREGMQFVRDLFATAAKAPWPKDPPAAQISVDEGMRFLREAGLVGVSA